MGVSRHITLTMSDVLGVIMSWEEDVFSHTCIWDVGPRGLAGKLIFI